MMMKKVLVTTTLTQELEVPDSWERMDVFDFLAENQSFRTAFQGVSNQDQTARIVDLSVVEEIVEEMGEEAYDD
jgi:23S rRNA G2445 N2-methylase RlmL